MTSSMTSPSASRRMTARDFLAVADDGNRYQLLDGEVCLNPSPVARHQRVLRRLYDALKEGLADSGGGELFFAPLDVVLDDADVTQPDLLYVSAARASIVGERNVQGAPDIVVEVLSDGTRRTDQVKKMRIYERGGVPSYWVVDPDADRLEIHVLEDGRYRLAGVHARPGVVSPAGYPALRIDLDTLFR